MASYTQYGQQNPYSDAEQGYGSYDVSIAFPLPFE